LHWNLALEEEQLLQHHASLFGDANPQYLHLSPAFDEIPLLFYAVGCAALLFLA
jgi:hypothetical protein